MISILLAIIYLAFISLGLPDALLGAAWPAIYPDLNIPVSYAGGISMIIAVGTIISSLLSYRLTQRFGTGKVTAFSVATTALALFGFSISRSYLSLCFWAIPYGLGAGSVDSSLNNYVALHYESKHMSWLHCMWGIGASLGPYVMGFVLSRNWGWNKGYLSIVVLQVLLTMVLFLSLPLWKETSRSNNEDDVVPQSMSLWEIVRVPGAKEVMCCFFCYCAIEQTAGLWSASYLNLHKGMNADSAASFGGLFFLGITLGRAICGFITMKLSDDRMVRLGHSIIGAGIIALLLPGPEQLSLLGLILVGLGCAPIYPCMIHATPERFGTDKSQAIIGVQMASAYVGTCLMPPLFGLIANHCDIALFPAYLLLILGLMSVMYNRLRKQG